MDTSYPYLLLKDAYSFLQQIHETRDEFLNRRRQSVLSICLVEVYEVHMRAHSWRCHVCPQFDVWHTLLHFRRNLDFHTGLNCIGLEEGEHRPAASCSHGMELPYSLVRKLHCIDRHVFHREAHLEEHPVSLILSQSNPVGKRWFVLEIQLAGVEDGELRGGDTRDDEEGIAEQSREVGSAAGTEVFLPIYYIGKCNKPWLGMWQPAHLDSLSTVSAWIVYAQASGADADMGRKATIPI
mmetsp:Transcript_44557/g.113364  ORF Transcript_44557/g.113364 Transcript_44557/m.113364 type:complete len:239 (-) Transcript_44557:70-786(-)